MKKLYAVLCAALVTVLSVLPVCADIADPPALSSDGTIVVVIAVLVLAALAAAIALIIRAVRKKHRK